MTCAITSIFKCSQGKQLTDGDTTMKKSKKKRPGEEGYKKMIEEADGELLKNKETNKKSSKKEVINTVDIEIKNFNKNADKVVINKLIVNNVQESMFPKGKVQQKKTISIGKKSHPLSDKQKKSTRVVDKKKTVNQVDDFEIESKKKNKNKKDLSIEPATMGIDQCGLKSCRSLLGVMSNEQRKSSVREGDGNYKSIMISPVSADSPLQLPKIPELDGVMDENNNRKDSSTKVKQTMANDQEKNEEMVRIANTQSISTATRGMGIDDSDAVDEIFKGNIFEKTNKGLSRCNMEEDTKEESTQKIDSYQD